MEHIESTLTPHGEYALAIMPLNKTEAMLLCSAQSAEVVRIDTDGRIYWHGREVETDDDFRAAMMDCAKMLAANARSH